MTRLVLALLWLLNSIVFVETFSHLGYMKSFYFYTMTVTTIGYGEITPQTSPEIIMVTITGWLMLITLIYEIVIFIIALIKEKTLRKLPEIIPLMIVSDDHIKVAQILNGLKENTRKYVVVLNDGSDTSQEQLERLREEQHNFILVRPDSIYQDGLFDDVYLLETAIITLSGDLNNVQNSHRALATVQVIEKMGNTRTITELPNLTGTLEKVSDGDMFLPATCGKILSQEVINPGYISKAEKLLEELKVK